MKKIKILAFDQSTALTGYAFFQESTLISYGLIDCRNRKSNEYVGINNMMKLICEKIAKASPEIVVFEDTVFSTNAKTLKDLSKIQGAILYYCFTHNIETKIYLPAQWRMLLDMQKKGAKRKELKKMAQIFVHNTFGVDAKEDVADAICIGFAYIKECLGIKGDKNND